MRNFILLLVMTFGICSCENFLDLNPKSEILGDKLFESSEGFEDALYGAYVGLGQEELYGEILSYYLPDLLAGYYLKENAGGQYEYLLSFQYTSSYFSGRSQFNNIWKKMYENISYVNNILRNLEGRENQLRYFNFYKGEALALRAFMHFELCSAFAPAYREETLDYPAIPYYETYEPLVYPFQTVGTIYSRVIRELKEAESLMETEGDYLNLERKDKPGIAAFMTHRQFHLNLYAVQGLLARVYWMRNDLDSAVIYADKVIRSEKFQFADKTNMGYEYASCISPDETLWAVQPFSEWNDGMEQNFNYSSDDPKAALLPLNGFWVDPNYYPEGMVEVENGYRKLFSVPTTGGQQDYRMNWFRQREGVNGKHGRFYKIYRNVGESKGTKGINMMRISEMYLIMAEGWLKKDVNKAKEYFDTYTRARGFVYGKNDAAFDIDLINKEYRKEFMGEGRTWFNMKRQNLSIPSCMYYGRTSQGSDKAYVWPIPEEEFEYREGGKEGVYPAESENVKPN